jgi:hypothetical protein
MHYTTLGPGDEATWPPFAGHPNDPRHSDDTLCAQDARDRAKDELLADPAKLSAILYAASRQAHGVIDTGVVQVEDITYSDIPELLVLLVSGTAEQAMQARYELREFIVRSHATQIERRAAELMTQPVQYHEEF